MYSQFYLIGLNEKGSFFKPLMIEFPEDPASYEDIEGKIMIGEALMLCAFYEENQNSKKFQFPNSHFNEYPSGKSVNNYREDLSNNEIELSGDLEKIHLFLRGGFILPYQNVFDKYIQNTLKLRDEKINFIVNIDNMKQSKAELFFDNDEVDSIDNNYFYRVDVYYNEKKLTFNTFSHNLDSYNYNDHILGKIEFWRAKEMLEVNNFNENVKVKVTDNEYKEIGNFEANYDSENDKLVYDFSEKIFSIFNITSIEFI
jgi:alpha-glucosidase (family GH31 glycosyl hydrolase)